jgi:hypothetical protein
LNIVYAATESADPSAGGFGAFSIVEDHMPEINTALLIALLPAILGLVNFCKALGAEGKVLTVISMAIGVVLALLAQLLPLGIFQTIFNGLVIGLAASGLFDLAAMVTRKPPITFIQGTEGKQTVNIDNTDSTPNQ